MNFTPTERLILANQYMILAKLYPEEGRYYDWCADVMRGGHEALYDQTEVQRLESDPFTQEESEYVWSVLRMYDNLIYSAQGKAEELSEMQRHMLTFPGFDHNTEFRQLEFANMLFKRGRGDFSLVIPNGAPNSHMPTESTYRRMLAAFARLPNRPNLTMEEVKSVLDAPGQSSDD